MRALTGLAFLLVAQGAPPLVNVPLGVCSLGDEAPSCWSPQGEPKPELLTEVKGLIARFRADALPISGARARYVVFRSAQDLTSVFRVDGGEARRVLTSIDGGGVLTLIRIDPPRARTVELRASLFVPVLPGHEIRFRRGVRADMDGDRVEIGAIRALPPDPSVAAHPERYAPDRHGRLWEGIVGHSAEAGPDLSLRFVPLDRRGVPILHVDPMGHPVSEAVGRAAYAKGVETDSVLPALFRPEWPGYGSSAAFRCELNIDPRDLARLRVIRVVPREERYPPLPLEPSGP